MDVNQKTAQSAGILQALLYFSLSKLEMKKNITRCLTCSGCEWIVVLRKKSLKLKTYSLTYFSSMFRLYRQCAIDQHRNVMNKYFLILHYVHSQRLKKVRFIYTCVFQSQMSFYYNMLVLHNCSVSLLFRQTKALTIFQTFPEHFFEFQLPPFL